MLKQTLIQLFVQLFISVRDKAATQFRKLNMAQDCHPVVKVDKDSHFLKTPYLEQVYQLQLLKPSGSIQLTSCFV